MIRIYILTEVLHGKLAVKNNNHCGVGVVYTLHHESWSAAVCTLSDESACFGSSTSYGHWRRGYLQS